MRLVVLIAFLALALRLVQLQTLSGARYSTRSLGQVMNVQHVPAIRGGIFDRNGAVLALSVQRSAVVADPFIIHDPKPEAVALARVLNVPVSTLDSELNENSGYVSLAKLVDSQVAQDVENLNLPGINVLPVNETVEPAASLASPVIGTVGADGEGQSGLEYQYDSLLSGRSGTLTDEEAPSGIVLPNAPTTGSSGEAGDGIELTLDESLQYVAERSLSSALVSSHALSGTVIVMNVHNGDILAMANLVSNPTTHKVTEAPENLALTSVYEPGSVFKLVTFSAALQAGVITPTSELVIPPYMTIDGSVFHDAEEHPTERLSATQVLAQSSNLGTIQIAERLGAKTVFDQMRRLGIGQPSGLDFPGESQGLVEALADWRPTDLASTAIGQNTAVTPMQVLDMMNTVATGGEFVPPRLVQAVVEPDGSVRELELHAEHRELTTSVTSQLTGMLEQVVSDGTAPAAAVPGYTVAGKTGTAQIPNPNRPGYLKNAYMATFTGFAPAEDPSLSAIVVLDRPTPIFGGAVAAPVFSQVMAYALERYGVPTSPGKAQGVTTSTVETYAYQSGTDPSAGNQAGGTSAGDNGSPGVGSGAGDGGTASDRETNSTIARSAGQNARSP
jgi:cell division protein FtsI (penicillin-binding protein 3)